MRCSQRKWNAVLAALLLAALPVAAWASPAAGAHDRDGSFVEQVDGWVEGWLSWLLPGWAAAGSETAPAAAPEDVVPGVDSIILPGCDTPRCTEGETLPDWDPLG